ncbi:MAG: uridine kinase [Anaerolineae bacterium]|nr:uridine kinase [Anaerolineae bacterium]
MSHKPVVFGVAGGTASGKTTVAETILNAVGAARVAYLPHDAYYRNMSHLPLSERAKLNYDHPSSLETELLVAHIEQLLEGQAVEVPVYDFTEHLRTQETTRVASCPLVLVEGILIFAEGRLRELMDIKVYVDTAADVRFIRRMVRDLEERGRSLDSIVKQYLETVRPMHMEFVEPSKQFADIIIPRGGLNKVAMEMVVSRLMELLRERQN